MPKAEDGGTLDAQGNLAPVASGEMATLLAASVAERKRRFKLCVTWLGLASVASYFFSNYLQVGGVVSVVLARIFLVLCWVLGSLAIIYGFKFSSIERCGIASCLTIVIWSLLLGIVEYYASSLRAKAAKPTLSAAEIASEVWRQQPRATISFNSQTHLVFRHGLHTVSPHVECTASDGSDLKTWNGPKVIDQDTIEYIWSAPMTGKCTATAMDASSSLPTASREAPRSSDAPKAPVPSMFLGCQLIGLPITVLHGTWINLLHVPDGPMARLMPGTAEYDFGVAKFDAMQLCRCDLISYGAEPAFRIMLDLPVNIIEAREGNNQQTPGGTIVTAERNGGTLRLSGERIGSRKHPLTIDKLAGNGDTYQFYVQNVSTHFLEIKIPEEVSLETGNNNQRQRIKLRRSENTIVSLAPREAAR